MTLLQLFKYHALGNDFLIWFDDPQGRDGEAAVRDCGALARRVCDRHRGIGADGLVVARLPRHSGDVAMELFNADGGPAETSGNGLRCLALALHDTARHRGPKIAVETATGMAVATLGAAPAASDSSAEPAAPGERDVEVTMGTVKVGPPGLEQSLQAVARLDGIVEARTVDTGNPHLVVVVGTLAGVDIGTVGPPLSELRSGGQNVEVVSASREGGLDLVVWERGAGATSACGSGSAAAAAAARAAGLVGDEVAVRNPGGPLRVALRGPADCPEATLAGPATFVARVAIEVAP